MFYYGSYSVL